jgi:hypothetical protein
MKKIDEKKIEMMLIDYPHLKNNHNSKVVKFLKI